MKSLLPGGTAHGKIIVTGERAECPVCHVPMPGRFIPDEFPEHIAKLPTLLQCRKCKREYEVYTSSDQRPSATSVH